MNVCATSLARGMTTLFCSNNAAALKAFVDKLPPQIRNICLNLSDMKKGDVGSFAKAVENLINELRNAEENELDYKEKIKVCSVRFEL